MIIAVLRFYRRHLTRFTLTPSCSEFALTAVREHGWVEGLELTLQRMPQHRRPKN